MKVQEVESRLFALIDEIKAQRETVLFEFEGQEDFEKEVEFVQSFAEHNECGLAFESLFWWYEQMHIKSSGANAVFFVELALDFGHKTKRDWDARFDLSESSRGIYQGSDFQTNDAHTPNTPSVKEVHAKFPEVESRLSKLIDEVEAQREIILYEFDGPEDFAKKIESLRRSVERFDYGLVYERLVCWYEQMPLQLCGPDAVYLVELALHFGYKTTRPEDARFDLSKHWLDGCTSNVFKPEPPSA